MTIVPPYLQPGDTIGIVCPAGYLPRDRAESCIQVLQQWGFRVKVGKTLGSQYNYFSGTDRDRLTDLQSMLDDSEVKAILCGRGGYGTGRIIGQLDFKRFRKNPKWIIGFSDITILHCHLFSNFKVASLHSPMAAAFNNGAYSGPYVQSLYKALTGEKLTYVSEPSEANVTGEATGKLVGGNLALLTHVIGTSSDVKTKNKILFIEDVGEYLYNLDRMLYQLKRSGKLDHLAALVVGSFSDMKDTTISFGKTAQEIIQDIMKDAAYPVCYNFPVGHVPENYTLKVGMPHKLVIDKEKIILQEL